jgi:hypothetical protein
MGSLSVLMECLEESEGSQMAMNGGLFDLDGGSAHDHSSDHDHSTDHDNRSSHSDPPLPEIVSLMGTSQPGLVGTGCKRKLDAVDFTPVGRDDMDAAEDCGQAANPQVPEVAHTLDEFYLPVRSALFNLVCLLSGPPPANILNVACLRDGVRRMLDELKRVSLVRPRCGVIRASYVVDLLRSEFIDRDAPGASEYSMSPGLSAWQSELDILLGSYASMPHEDLSESIQDIQYDMENHLATIQYVCEQFEDFLLEERASEMEDNRRVEHMLQQRFAASLASRV